MRQRHIPHPQLIIHPQQTNPRIDRMAPFHPNQTANLALLERLQNPIRTRHQLHLIRILANQTSNQIHLFHIDGHRILVLCRTTHVRHPKLGAHFAAPQSRQIRMQSVIVVVGVIVFEVKTGNVVAEITADLEWEIIVAVISLFFLKRKSCGV